MSNETPSVREEKLNRIREELGVDPYPARAERTATVLDARNNGETDTPLSVCGRITGKREHGKTVFADLADATGSIQLYLGKKVLSEKEWNLLGLLDLGDIVQVTGPVFTTRTEELTVKCTELKVLSKSLRQLPVVKVDSSGVAHDEVSDSDLLYRHRCVDLLVNPDSRKRLLGRSAIVSALRNCLDSKGFLEVETPVLQPIYGGAAADPFETEYRSMGRTFYLRIATELYLKRLVAGGIEKVYELGKDFRNEGIDRTHSPEFTQLELYEAYADYNVMMKRFEELVLSASEAFLPGDSVVYRGTELDLSPPFRRIGFMDSLRRASGEDLFDWETEDLRKLLESEGIRSDSENRLDILDKLFDHYVADRIVQPTFVVDYPKELSPLAKRNTGVEGVTERFEAFAAGLELANAFSEQNDPLLQREILERQAAESEHRKGRVDQDFLYALEIGMPPTGGLGIGVDRLVMLLTDTGRIRDTVMFPHLRQLNK